MRSRFVKAAVDVIYIGKLCGLSHSKNVFNECLSSTLFGHLGGKPLPGPMLVNCQFAHTDQTLVNQNIRNATEHTVFKMATILLDTYVSNLSHMSQGMFRRNSADTIPAYALATQGTRYSHISFTACIVCTTETQPGDIFISLQPKVLFGVPKITLAPGFPCLETLVCYYVPGFQFMEL